MWDYTVVCNLLGLTFSPRVAISILFVVVSYVNIFTCGLKIDFSKGKTMWKHYQLLLFINEDNYNLFLNKLLDSVSSLHGIYSYVASF